MKRRKPGFTRKYLAIPYAVFMLVFVVFPLVVLVLYAFSKSAGDGALTFDFTFANFQSVFHKNNMSMLLSSLEVGLITTLICLAIGYPVACILNGKRFKNSHVMVMLFMLPMWINFLLRTLATQAIFNAASVPFGMGTVIFGMVYNYLPFMIMPIYTTIQKIDGNLLEGASDLGASPARSFLKVTLPLSLPGVLSGITMVFMPTITTFAISGLLSYNKIGLIGDYINMQVSKSFNVASAMSLIILIIIGISMLLVNKYDKESLESGGGLW